MLPCVGICGPLASSKTLFFLIIFFYENGASASSCCASFHFFFLILLSFMKYDQVFAFQRQTSCRQQLPRSWQPPRPIEHLYHYYNAAAGSSDIQISSSGPVRQPHYTQYCTHTQGHKFPITQREDVPDAPYAELSRKCQAALSASSPVKYVSLIKKSSWFIFIFLIKSNAFFYFKWSISLALALY